MITVDNWEVIQGDEGCRDGHYRAKQDLRQGTVTGSGADLAVELDPNDSTSLRAQNPTDLGKLRIGVASEEAAGIPAIWTSRARSGPQPRPSTRLAASPPTW